MYLLIYFCLNFFYFGVCQKTNQSISFLPTQLPQTTKKLTNIDTQNPCAEIDKAFKNVTEPDELPACRCLPESLGILHDSQKFDANETKNDSYKIWIGCTRQSMPTVFRSLNALKRGTQVSEMWIWNSLINILPNEMFANVKPITLIIESSGVSVIRTGAFSSIGKNLQSLSLKNNILKTIERKTFSDLSNLRSLDLSGNKLSKLRKDQFDDLRLLESLFLFGNQIYSIEDGTFESLKTLRVLNLNGNRITNITKNTFRGLNNLEELNLSGNNIYQIDKDAFLHMKKLKILNLGYNKISELELRNLNNLLQLFLQNNSFKNLANLSLQNLSKLILLNVDCNRLNKIEDSDFFILAHSNLHKMENKGASLTTLSLVNNNISEIGCRAFDNLPKLEILSLQRNRIKTLSCSINRESILVQSTLQNLKNLIGLFLSENEIDYLDDGDVNGLSNLKILALDYNKIRRIGRNSFKGLNLTDLYLNNNRLYYLPEGIFDDWNVKEIKAVDISNNPRECICDREWLDKWLIELGPANVKPAGFGCFSVCGLGKSNDDLKREKANELLGSRFENHKFWITIIAIILAIIALMFLVAAAYIYIQSNCLPYKSAGLSLKNLPSDMIKLIPSQDSLLSFPNPISGNNNSDCGLKFNFLPSSISSISLNLKSKKNQKDVDNIFSSFQKESSKNEKKRVRFNDI